MISEWLISSLGLYSSKKTVDDIRTEREMLRVGWTSQQRATSCTGMVHSSINMIPEATRNGIANEPKLKARTSLTFAIYLLVMEWYD